MKEVVDCSDADFKCDKAAGKICLEGETCKAK